jgi:hypothetical protein
MSGRSEADQDYLQSHQDRVNLVIHLLAVPLFWLAAARLLIAPFTPGLQGGFQGLVMISLSMGLQGYGHRRESVAPLPFQSPLDFLTRILAEQFVKFPAFLFSGRWWRSYRQ